MFIHKAAMPKSEATSLTRRRYYIGEWYGHDFATLSQEQRSAWSIDPPKNATCPYKSGIEGMANKRCSKEGGVCSLRLYERSKGGEVTPCESRDTLCPHRFLEGGTVFSWVGAHILNDPEAAIVSEVPFLTPTARNSGNTGSRSIGKIDHVLVTQKKGLFEWCAVEMQAVYFSGKNMQQDIGRHSETTSGLIWPSSVRRPDYRSSGPKRLMAQLQTKVPTISRWGKKTAVVIDNEFWNSLGKKSEIDHLSNAEVVWFVPNYVPCARGGVSLKPKGVHYTTLDSAVAGLTGGAPMPRDRFESELRQRLGALAAKTGHAR
jgi:hypothetical protein